MVWYVHDWRRLPSPKGCHPLRMVEVQGLSLGPPRTPVDILQIPSPRLSGPRATINPAHQAQLQVKFVVGEKRRALELTGQS